jgi:hypothetical protein
MPSTQPSAFFRQELLRNETARGIVGLQAKLWGEIMRLYLIRTARWCSACLQYLWNQADS